MQQASAAQSPTDAEYVAAAEASKELIWVKSLLCELEHKQNTVNLYGDNRSALAIGSNPEFHARTKHINTRYHLVKEYIKNKETHFKYISSGENIADILTKPLEKGKHTSHVRGLGLQTSLEGEC